MADRQISREDFERRFGRPSPEDLEPVVGFLEGQNEYNRAYQALRGRGLSHEDTVQTVQQILYGQVRSPVVGKENSANRALAGIAEQTPNAAPQISAARAALGLPQQQFNQLRLDLSGVTRSNGRFASPTKVSNPPTEELLAALASGRAVDQPPAPAPMPLDQLPIDFSAKRAELEQVIRQAEQAPYPRAHSAGSPDGWRRMAGRWGLPALAALGGFTGLALATGVEQPREQQPQAV